MPEDLHGFGGNKIEEINRNKIEVEIAALDGEYMQ